MGYIDFNISMFAALVWVKPTGHQILPPHNGNICPIQTSYAGGEGQSRRMVFARMGDKVISTQSDNVLK